MNLNLRHIRSVNKLFLEMRENQDLIIFWSHQISFELICVFKLLFLFKDVVYNSYRFSSWLEILKTNLKTKYFWEFDHESDGIPDFLNKEIIFDGQHKLLCPTGRGFFNEV